MGEVVDFEKKKTPSEKNQGPLEEKPVEFWPNISIVKLSAEQLKNLNDLRKKLKVDELSAQARQREFKKCSQEELFGLVREIANKDPEEVACNWAKEAKAILNEFKHRCYRKQVPKDIT